MYRKIAIAAATAVGIVGVGTAALAATGSDSTSGSATTHTSKQHGKHDGKHGKKELRALLRHTVHGSVTTKGKDGYVVHSGIRGTVTAVSATSITVKASDGYTETFTVGTDTKVRKVSGDAGSRKAAKSTMTAVKDGDTVGVIGKKAETSTADPGASVVVDGLRK